MVTIDRERLITEKQNNKASYINKFFSSSIILRLGATSLVTIFVKSSFLDVPMHFGRAGGTATHANRSGASPL